MVTGRRSTPGGPSTRAGGVEANSAAKWDGTSWSPLAGVGNGTNGIPLDMVVFDDGTGPALYMGGTFSVAGSILANRIARWDGTHWSAVGSGLIGGSVSALGVFDDGTGGGPALYAGGSFTSAGGLPSTDKIASWNGINWSKLGPQGAGLNSSVSPFRIRRQRLRSF